MGYFDNIPQRIERDGRTGLRDGQSGETSKSCEPRPIHFSLEEFPHADGKMSRNLILSEAHLTNQPQTVDLNKLLRTPCYLADVCSVYCLLHVSRLVPFVSEPQGFSATPEGEFARFLMFSYTQEVTVRSEETDIFTTKPNLEHWVFCRLLVCIQDTVFCHGIQRFITDSFHSFP